MDTPHTFVERKRKELETELNKGIHGKFFDLDYGCDGYSDTCCGSCGGEALNRDDLLKQYEQDLQEAIQQGVAEERERSGKAVEWHGHKIHAMYGDTLPWVFFGDIPEEKRMMMVYLKAHEDILKIFSPLPPSDNNRV